MDHRNVFDVDDNNDISWQSQSLDKKPKKKNKKIIGLVIVVLFAVVATMTTSSFYLMKNTKIAKENLSNTPQIEIPIKDESSVQNNLNEFSNVEENTDIVQNIPQQKEEISTNNGLTYEPIIDISPEIDINKESENNYVDDNFYFEEAFCDPEKNYYCFVRDGELKKSEVRYEFFTEWLKANIPWILEPNRPWMTGVLDIIAYDIDFYSQTELNMNYEKLSIGGQDLYVIDINSENNTITIVPENSHTEEELPPVLFELKILPITSVYEDVKVGDVISASIEIERIDKANRIVYGYVINIEI